MAGLLAHGVRLPSVLRHTGMDCLDDVWTDWGAEDHRQWVSLVGGLAIGACGYRQYC